MPKEVIFTPRETTEVLLFIKDNMVTRPDVEEIVNKAIDTRVPGIVHKIVLEVVHPIVNKAKQELIDHVDRKTAEVQGDLVVISRKLDDKIDLLTDTLAHKKVLTKNEATRVKEASPFPHL